MTTIEAIIKLKDVCDNTEDCNKCEIKKILNECVYETIPEEWKIKNKEK